MVYVRSLRGSTRSRHVGLVPTSLACAASRRLPLSGAVRFLNKPALNASSETGSGGTSPGSPACSSEKRP